MVEVLNHNFISFIHFPIFLHKHKRDTFLYVIAWTQNLIPGSHLHHIKARKGKYNMAVTSKKASFY